MRLTFLVILLAVISTTSQAKPHLRDVVEVDGALLAVGLADEIRQNCPVISARMLKALKFVYDLRARARELGYTDEEIDAYRKSDEEKARLRALGEAWLAANGVDKAAPETYCVAGRAEIKKQSQIGALLEVN